MQIGAENVETATLKYYPAPAAQQPHPHRHLARQPGPPEAALCFMAVISRTNDQGLVARTWRRRATSPRLGWALAPGVLGAPTKQGYSGGPPRFRSCRASRRARAVSATRRRSRRAPRRRRDASRTSTSRFEELIAGGYIIVGSPSTVPRRVAPATFLFSGTILRAADAREHGRVREGGHPAVPRGDGAGGDVSEASTSCASRRSRAATSRRSARSSTTGPPGDRLRGGPVRAHGPPGDRA